jgi:hypothetical protein
MHLFGEECSKLSGVKGKITVVPYLDQVNGNEWKWKSETGLFNCKGRHWQHNDFQVTKLKIQRFCIVYILSLVIDGTYSTYGAS